MAYPALSMDDAAQLTWRQVSLEAVPDAAHRLSADIVATDENDQPIISVIHLDDRRHWNLTVGPATPEPGSALRGRPGAVSVITWLPELPDVLGKAREGDLVVVMGEGGWWTVTVEILEPATI
jgi:hypothetical protein